jgi:large subunit ribosomal protein L22
VTATKTNERPGTRAVHRHAGLSASKARHVLDLIRGEDVQRAAEILTGTEREAATVVGKVLTSAVANAQHNDQQNPEELYVSACYADEAATMKRWRPRARGRATRIRKRTCHITIIVSRLPAEQLELRRRRLEAVSSHRSRRVEGSRRRADLSGRLSRRRAAQAERAAAAEAEQALEAIEAEAEHELPAVGADDVNGETTDEETADETAIEATASEATVEETPTEATAEETPTEATAEDTTTETTTEAEADRAADGSADDPSGNAEAGEKDEDN